MLDVFFQINKWGEVQEGGCPEAPRRDPGGFILLSFSVSFFEVFSERCFLGPGVDFGAFLELKMVQHLSKF